MGRGRAQAESRQYGDQPSRSASHAPESTAVSPFNFEGCAVHVVVEDDGEPWFVAMEVSAALGYSDAYAMTKRLDDDEKSNRQIGGLGSKSGGRGVLVINESGLYSAILGSNKPEAKRFKRWVTSEILPCIRKTGRYEAPRQESQPSSDALAIAGEQHKVVGILLDEVGTLKGSVDELRDGLADARRDIEHLRSGSLLSGTPRTILRPHA